MKYWYAVYFSSCVAHLIDECIVNACYLQEERISDDNMSVMNTRYGLQNDIVVCLQSSAEQVFNMVLHRHEAEYFTNLYAENWDSNITDDKEEIESWLWTHVADIIETANHVA